MIHMKSQKNAEITIDTEKLTAEESSEIIVQYVKDNYIK